MDTPAPTMQRRRFFPYYGKPKPVADCFCYQLPVSAQPTDGKNVSGQ